VGVEPLLVLSLALLVGTADPAAVAPPVQWTEADALVAFERGSQPLADARAAEAGARGDLIQAGLLPNPTLNLSAANIPLRANPPPTGNGPGWSRNLVTSVELDQQLELGGKRGKRQAQARAALASAVAGTADARRTALFELRTAFWNAVRAHQRRLLAEQVTGRSAETLRIGKVRLDSEDISKADFEKIELEAMQQENDRDDAVAGERSAVANLLALVGPAAPPSVELRGELAIRPPALDEARLALQAAEARSDIRAARFHAEAARAAARLASAQAIPDVTLGVGYSRSYAVGVGDNPDSMGVTFSVPLPLFHRNQGEVARASAEAERADRAASALQARVARDVAAAMARYRAAADKVARYDGGALQRADRALQVAEKTWRAGDRSLLEYLEAERTWVALRGDYLDTLFELRQAAFELEKAVGHPVLEDA
jgi:cobalt-zinc-cadmium efflux system outer membrane protein